jgi:uncharacterized membrane protein
MSKSDICKSDFFGDLVILVPISLLLLLVGTLLLGFYEKHVIDSYKYQKHIKCVESVKIPVGECSRLFREEK